MKIKNSILWISLSLVFILMSIFSSSIEKVAKIIGFETSANFIYVAIIAFLFIQVFTNTIEITILSNKIKNLNHYIALKNYEKEKKD